MAEKDIAERTFISLNDVFADIFNVLVFQGEHVVQEDALADANQFSQYKADCSSLHEQERDTHKLWRKRGMNLILTGIESQTAPDRDMPFRIISYDGSSYRSQLLKTKKKKIRGVRKRVASKERYPVVTIVLYFGKDPWKYSTHLKDCFYPKLSDDWATMILNEYIQDYKVHVFDIPRLPAETVQKFQSEFRLVAEYFTNVYTNPEYVPDKMTITHVDEFLKLMRVLTGDNKYEKMLLGLTQQEKKAGIEMCRVLDYHEALGEARGKAIGKGIGENRLHKLMSVLAEQGYALSEVLLMTAEDNSREKLYNEYGIV